MFFVNTVFIARKTGRFISNPVFSMLICKLFSSVQHPCIEHRTFTTKKMSEDLTKFKFAGIQLLVGEF